MKSLIGALFCAMALSVFGGNRIFNGNFQCGTAGFGLFRLLREENNPQYQFNGLFTENGRLAMNNPYGEYFQICSMEFDLPAHQQITFTSDFTAPAGSKIAFTVLRIEQIALSQKWLVYNRTLPATGKDQQIKLTFNTGNYGGSYMLVVYPHGNPVGNYRFRHFTIAGGEKEGLFALINADRNYYLLGQDKQAVLSVTVGNPADQMESGVLTLLTADQELGTAGAAPVSRKVTLKPGANQFQFTVPVTRYGFFRVKPLWNGKALCSIDGVFPVIGKYENQGKIDWAKTFVVSVNGNPATGWQPKRGNSIGGFPSCGEKPEDKLKLLELMGCRLMRDWDSGRQLCTWLDVEPEDGKFDFTRFDRELDRLERHHITLFPVVGRMYENWTPYQHPFRPEWLNKKLIHVAKNPPRTDPKFKINVPPMELWERYLAAIVRHAGERIPFYEIMNEPNLNLFPELYLKYLKSAYAVIKRTRPEAVVIGICSTGDLGADCENYFSDCIKLGAANYADWLSFHPYNNRTLNSPAPADRQIAYLQSISQGKPVVNSEIYYLYDWPNVMDGAGQSKCHARHVSTRFLIDLGEGLLFSSCINSKQLWLNRLLPNFGTSYRIESLPNDCFVAYNALARLFEGAKPAGKFKSDNGAVIYRYTRNGRPQAAAWEYRKTCTMALDCQGMEVRDVFGNLQKPGLIRLGENPVYLFPGKLSDAEFIRRLSKPHLVITNPVQTASAGRLFDGQLYLTLWNAAPTQETAEVMIAGGKEIASAELPASGSVVLPLRYDGKNTSATIRLLGEKTVEKQVAVHRTGSARYGETISGKSADGKLSFTGKVTAENGKTIISVQVKDATPSGEAKGRARWQQDCTELFIDAEPLRVALQRPEAYTAKVSRFFINPYLKEQLEVQSREFNAGKLSCKVSRLPDGYGFTLTLPKTFPVLGFGIKVDDGTADGTKVQAAYWGATPRSYCDRLSFGLLSAAPEKTVKHPLDRELPAGKFYRLTGNHQKPCAILSDGKIFWNTIPGQVTEYLYLVKPGKVTVKGELKNPELTEISSFTGNLAGDGSGNFWQGSGKTISAGFPAGGKSIQLTPGKQFFSRYLPMIPGLTSVFDFWAKTEKEELLDVVLNSWSRYRHQGNHCYSRQKVKLIPGWHHYQVRWKVPQEDKNVPDLAEHLLKIQFIPKSAAIISQIRYQVR